MMVTISSDSGFIQKTYSFSLRFTYIDWSSFDGSMIGIVIALYDPL